MAENTGATSLSDRGASYLRTAVPAAWGFLVAQLVVVVSPHLPGDLVDGLRDWLGGPAAIGLVTAAATYAWYWVARKIEPHLPDIVTRILLGSAAAPRYVKTEPKHLEG